MSAEDLPAADHALITAMLQGSVWPSRPKPALGGDTPVDVEGLGVFAVLPRTRRC